MFAALAKRSAEAIESLHSIDTLADFAGMGSLIHPMSGSPPVQTRQRARRTSVDHGHGQFSYDVELDIGQSLTVNGRVITLLDVKDGEVSLLVEQIDGDSGTDSWDFGFPELTTSFTD